MTAARRAAWWLGMALALPVQAAPVTFNFDDGTLQGWIDMGWGTNHVISRTGGDMGSGHSAPNFAGIDDWNSRDSSTSTLWLRSPAFVLNAVGSLTDMTFHLAGGQGGGTSTLPANESAVPTGEGATPGGFMGLALRDTTTGNFVLKASRSGSGSGWQALGFTASQLAAATTPGRAYTLDFIDVNRSGGWNWIALDSIAIPGTAVPVVTTTISGRVTAAATGVPNVMVTSYPGSFTATTNASGNYEITNAPAGVTYTLTVTNLPAGKLLETAPASFTALETPNTGKDFTLKDTTTISGRVTAAASGIRYVVVKASPGGLTGTTDGHGNYTITGASSGVSYTLSASNLPSGQVVATAPAPFVAFQAPNSDRNFTLAVAPPIASPGDTDADGLPDAYEIAAVGNTISLSAAGDFDGDGTRDVAEYSLGLIPNDPTSTFKLTMVNDPATGDVVLTWPSKQGARFEVQWSESMASGTWSTIGTVSAPAGSTSSYTDSGNDIHDYPRGFYRVTLTSGEAYVYSSFTGDGEDGLHLLTSADGKTWKAVKNYASLYQQSGGLMRDPSVCRGGDGVYHLVWTTGWWNDTIGIAHSYNLIDWTPMQRLHIWADYAGPGSEESDGSNWPADLSQDAPRHPKVRNCWAPEIFYDDQTAEYVIFWATTIDDASVFPQTWDANRWERMNQRIYYITTRDFNTYSPRKFFYAKPDRVVIDACITKLGRGQYRMVIKDELTQRLHVVAPTRPLTTWADMPGDFWGPMSDPAFTGPGVQPDNTNAEGPSVVRVGNEWFVYCDYWLAGRNGLFSTKDFTTMTRLNDQFVAPTWVRHGTAFKVPKADYEKLEALR